MSETIVNHVSRSSSRSQLRPAAMASGAHSSEERQIIGLISRKLLPFLAVIYIVAYVDRAVLGFAKLHMNADVGIGDAAYGLGAGLFFVGYFLCEVPSNLALERFGPRLWFARILATWGLITIAMSLISGPLSFYILRFLLGAAEAGLYPGILYVLTKWFPLRHRARIIGLLVLAQPIALIVTGPIAGLILSTPGAFGLSNWQVLFIVCGLPAMLLALPTLWILPASPRHARWLTPHQLSWIERELAAEKTTLKLESHSNPLRAITDRRVLLLALLFLPFPLAIYGLSLWLPTIIKQFGVSDLAIGFLSTVPYLFAVAGLCIIPAHSDARGERHWHIVVVAALAAVTLAASAFVETPALQLLFLSLAAFCIYPIQAVIWTLPGVFLTGASAAVGIATINSLANLGGYIGPYGIGLLKDATGSTAAGLYFLAAVLLFGVFMAFVVRASLDKTQALKSRR
ncbi:MFS transporter [Beijerinckia indica]|uniref:Major facilitator superfamily MFS_1 n=1 Tax=Beijerinckia indica subsp. indica (strain ATCC 9039 / DSM 1715 / NCIMB 8712) TaxID=395963 RepID=B2IBL4_BEII9|nr:MFS transporter [Beijerinckia indica]ACB96640.1 major facilitator superfamily MFS_1 [Beijerinckia indica subsp. indica ATCC 9039]